MNDTMKTHVKHYAARLIPQKSTKATTALCLMVLLWLKPSCLPGTIKVYTDPEGECNVDDYHSNTVPVYSLNYCTRDVSRIRQHLYTQIATFKGNIPFHISC